MARQIPFRTLTNWSKLLLVVEYDGPDRVEEGENFTITCNAPQFGLIKWRLNDTISDFGGNSPPCAGGDKCTSYLTVSFATSSHTGKYKCSYEDYDFGHNVMVVAGEERRLSFVASSCNPEYISY